MLYSYRKVSKPKLENEHIFMSNGLPVIYIITLRQHKVVLGSKRHWRLTNQTLCTFLTSKKETLLLF